MGKTRNARETRGPFYRCRSRRSSTVLFVPSDVLYVVEFTFTGRFDPHYPPQLSNPLRFKYIVHDGYYGKPVPHKRALRILESRRPQDTPVTATCNVECYAACPFGFKETAGALFT